MTARHGQPGQQGRVWPGLPSGLALLIGAETSALPETTVREWVRALFMAAPLSGQGYGYASNYVAITHPSLPKYLAIASGSTHSITDDQDPASHPLHGRSVFGQAILHSRTAALYAEGMDVPCAARDTGSYVVQHNPWAYFVRERELCRDHEFSMPRLTFDIAEGALPRVGMLGHPRPGCADQARCCALGVKQ